MHRDPFYDEVTEVIAKALHGSDVSFLELKKRALVCDEELQNFLDGALYGDRAEACAKALKLNIDALRQLENGAEPILLPKEIERLVLPFEGDSVNAWLIQVEGRLLLFDLGFKSEDLLQALGRRNPDICFITHAHRDHVGGLSLMRERGVPVFFPEANKPVEPWVDVGIRVQPVSLDGHYIPAFGYYLKASQFEVFVCGDALYSGSIGKTLSGENYRLALKTLSDALDEISEQCLILPGHGPVTSLCREKKLNAFL